MGVCFSALASNATLLLAAAAIDLHGKISAHEKGMTLGLSCTPMYLKNFSLNISVTTLNLPPCGRLGTLRDWILGKYWNKFFFFQRLHTEFSTNFGATSQTPPPPPPPPRAYGSHFMKWRLCVRGLIIAADENAQNNSQAKMEKLGAQIRRCKGQGLKGVGDGFGDIFCRRVRGVCLSLILYVLFSPLGREAQRSANGCQFFKTCRLFHYLPPLSYALPCTFLERKPGPNFGKLPSVDVLVSFLGA